MTHTRRITRVRLSASEARRIALAAQGFADPLPGVPPTRRHLRRVVGRTRLFQMDSVNVAVRAHYMPMFSRIGRYDPILLDSAAWRSTARTPRLLTEYWAHEAALIPVDDWPLFGWRMADYRFGRYARGRNESPEQTRLRAEIRAALTDLGPSTSSTIEGVLGRRRETPRRGSWWDRSEVKHACEVMLAAGEIAAVRRGNFARHYDLAERIVGAERAATLIDRETAVRTLVRQAVSALGIATEIDIRDYYRLPVDDARDAVAELAANGELTSMTVDGWTAPAYLDPTARIPRAVTRSALLAPFDPLVFFRPRLARMFGMDYRIEIYVPESKRAHGYYVFPYLMDETMAARVDLKADRANGILRVVGAFTEPDADPHTVVPRLADDLRVMGQWLGLSGVVAGRRGDLAEPLRRELV